MLCPACDGSLDGVGGCNEDLSVLESERSFVHFPDAQEEVSGFRTLLRPFPRFGKRALQSERSFEYRERNDCLKEIAQK